jgi:hypothetical protein
MTTLLIIFFLATTILWLCYWVLVRPVILDAVQIELAELRSAVDWAIIEGLSEEGLSEEGLSEAQSKPAQQLAADLKQFQSARMISLSVVIFVVLRHRAMVKAITAKDKATFENSPVWIREIRQKKAQLNIKAALANSPIWWIPLAALSVAAVFSKRIADWLTDTQTAASKLHPEDLSVVA